MATSVLPLDDHPSFRATARLLLEAEGHDVVGEAGDGLSGISKGELSDAALAAAGAMTALKRALWTIGAAAVALGGVAIALVATSDHEATRTLTLVLGPFVGWSFVGVGLYAWWRRPVFGLAPAAEDHRRVLAVLRYLEAG